MTKKIKNTTQEVTLKITLADTPVSRVLFGSGHYKLNRALRFDNFSV